MFAAVVYTLDACTNRPLPHRPEDVARPLLVSAGDIEHWCPFLDRPAILIALARTAAAAANNEGTCPEA